MTIELNTEEWALVVFALTTATLHIERNRKVFCDAGDVYHAQAEQERLDTIASLKDRLYK